jgi:uncharacterized membrane protein YfcA
MSPVLHAAIAAAILCGGGFFQSTTGFGFALFATPLLVLMGMPLPQTVLLVSFGSLAQSLLGARHLRADVPWRLVAYATVLRIAGLLAGLFVLAGLAAVSLDRLRLGVGALLTAIVVVQLVWRPKPAPSIHPAWGVTACLFSGLLAGVVGMGGPPLVLWSMAHDWSAARIRGFLFACFACAIPLQIALMLVVFRVSLPPAPLLLCLLPAVLLGTALGMPVGNRLPRARLRAIAYAVLLAIGVCLFIPGLAVRG